MNKIAQEVLKRIKGVIREVAFIVDSFPKKTTAFTIAKQIIDSVTSIGANYVEAQSSRSKREFVSIMGIVLRETKETLFWLEVIVELRLTHQSKIDKVYQECVELSKMFTAVILTSSRNLNGVNNNLPS